MLALGQWIADAPVSSSSSTSLSDSHAMCVPAKRRFRIPSEANRSIWRLPPKRSPCASMSSRSTFEWVTTPTSERAASSNAPVLRVIEALDVALPTLEVVARKLVGAREELREVVLDVRDRARQNGADV